MKSLHVFIRLIFLSQFVFAQHPTFVKKWDKRFGGTATDLLFSFQKTSDGGYILGGCSVSSIGGDKTESSWGSQDYWIVKIDSSGDKEWDKRFGGTGFDALHNLSITSDGGYILGGISDSEISGDKTQPNWGGGDYWIIKVDSVGGKQWDRRFGGNSDENLWALQPTNDGGYIFGGYSNSGISGDKTEENWDPTYFYDDGWLVKVDSFGNKQWDIRLGGTNHDGISSLVQSNDGGYVVACYSASDSSGDKTQDSRGYGDFWAVKIDSFGNKEWDKRYGGVDGEYSPNISKTYDGGYIIGGKSDSGISGDKSQIGNQWFVKLDSSGNMSWEKSLNGGIGLVNSIVQTLDGGYLIASEIQGISGPDKSEPNLGPSQTWVVKTDSAGNKQWDKTIFSPNGQLFGHAVQSDDGCYVVATYAIKVGGYVTEPNRDITDSTTDYWVLKFCWEIPNSTSLLPDAEMGVRVYPNPFTTGIAIQLQIENLKEAAFTISNRLGVVVFYKKENNLASSYTKMLDLSYLPNGVYLIEVEVDGERVVKKVVKE